MSCIVIAALVHFGAFDSLMLFVLAGIVPGTTYAIPSTFMLLIMTSTAWLLLFLFVPFDTIRSSFKKHAQKSTPTRRLPRQRFKQV